MAIGTLAALPRTVGVCSVYWVSRWRISENAGAAEHFAAEREIIFTLIGKPHQVEAITANSENRAPVFKNVG